MLEHFVSAVRSLLTSGRTRRQRKFLRYVQRLPGIRLDIVTRVRSPRAPEFGRLEPRERALALLLMRQAMPLDELSASVAALPPPSPDRLFDELFLQEASEIAKRIGQAGYREEAMRILHILQLISHLTGKVSWSARIHKDLSGLARY